MKKLTFDRQILLGLGLLLLMEVCSWIFKRGIFVNIAWVVYGLAFVIHPVYPDGAKGRPHVRLAVRLGGLFCVLVGVMTRFVV